MNSKSMQKAAFGGAALLLGYYGYMKMYPSNMST